ncbi:MAG: DUF58 domain-containing protein [Clostridiales bacterium]|nr:DUF58 domain-containing protein [Clostridiales bacterium]
MNKNLIILVVLWILSLVGISFYGGAVSYGFFIVITLIPVISLIYMLFVFLKFTIYQKIDIRNLISNQTAPFYFTLQDESMIAFSGVRVIFYSTFSTINGLNDGIEYELHPHKGIQKKTQIVCKYRGEYEVGIKQVVIRDFFRLFSICYRNREPLRVIVKPNLVYISDLRSAEIALSAARDSGANRTEPDVLVREYVPGDDRRLIHWKSTAATHKLMVRERIGEEQQGIGIIMDSQRFSVKMEDYLPVENKILETVLALTLFFTGKNVPVTAYYMNREMTETVIEGTARFDDFYEEMAKFSFRKENEHREMFARILQNGRIFSRKMVFMVLHKWSSPAATMAEELSRNHIPVVAYIISDESTDRAALEQISRTTVVTVPTDADLKEVL